MEDRISRLIYRNIIGTLTAEERAELDAFIAEDPANAALVNELEMVHILEIGVKARDLIDTTRPAADMQRRINEIRMRRNVRRFGAAAAVIVVLVAIGFLIKSLSGTESLDGNHSPAIAKTLVIDSITPGKSSAILVTEEGESLPLNYKESGSSVKELAELASNEHRVPISGKNLSLTIPRGGEFQIMLEDSTRVWLNSASKLSYPEVFGEEERRVSVEGEAYFEVKRDEKRPFIVESRGQSVKVYGTTFNIKAYPDEAISYTTLETGSISLTSTETDGGELFLSPGHQARLNHSDHHLDMKVVKTEVITSWRHGRFVFEEQPLEEIMRDLGRWYDFEYEFEDEELKKIIFLGSIPRYAEFRTAIMILERSGGITFSASGNKIIVSKKRY